MLVVASSEFFKLFHEPQNLLRKAVDMRPPLAVTDAVLRRGHIDHVGMRAKMSRDFFRKD